MPRRAGALLPLALSAAPCERVDEAGSLALGFNGISVECLRPYVSIICVTVIKGKWGSSENVSTSRAWRSLGCAGNWIEKFQS